MSFDPAYLNGVFLPLDRCRVSVLDRGFMFGDGVYEVIPVYNGKPFEGGRHLTRLTKSLVGMSIANPHTDAEWENVIEKLIKAVPSQDLAVYLQVTRGVAPRSHYTEEKIPATAFAMTMPLDKTQTSVFERGVNAVTAEDVRWHRCDIKTTSLAANVLLRKKAAEADVGETILLRDGMVTEGAASNVFVIFGDAERARLLTAPKDRWILAGITRGIVIDLAREHKIAFAERRIPEQEFRSADEVWLTSSTREILPVTFIDGRPIGKAAPGPVWKKFKEWMDALKI